MTLQRINNKQATGVLNADINDTATTLTLGSGEGTNFPEGPSVFLIDDELIWYGSKGVDTFSGLVRGYGGTTAASHTAGADVDSKVSAEWFNSIRDRVLDDILNVDAASPSDGFALVFDAATPTYSQVPIVDAMVYDNGTTQTTEEALLTYDGDLATWWNSGNGGLTASYDFGEAVAIRRIRMYVSNRNGVLSIWTGNTGLLWTLGYTNTGETITTINGQWVEVDLPDLGAHRYWQFRGSSQKAINDVEFYVIDSEGSWKASGISGTVQDGNQDGDMLIYRTGAYTLGSQVANSPVPWIYDSGHNSTLDGDAVWPTDGGKFESLSSAAFSEEFLVFAWDTPQRFAGLEIDLNSSYGIDSFDIQYSNDGVNWTILRSYTGYNGNLAIELDWSDIPNIPEAYFWKLGNVVKSSFRWEVTEMRWFEADATSTGGAWVPFVPQDELPATGTEGAHLTRQTVLGVGVDYSGTAPTVSTTGLLAGTATNLLTFPRTTSNTRFDATGIIEYDFSTPVRLAGFLYVSSHGSNYMDDGVLQYSADGTNWVTDVTGITGAVGSGFHQIVPVVTKQSWRYWRLVVTSFNGSNAEFNSWVPLEGIETDSVWVSTPLAVVGEDISSAIRVLTGFGTPESAVTADIGTMYLRLDGGTSTTLYVKESGTGNTGWVAK